MIFGRIRKSLLPRKFPAIRYLTCTTLSLSLSLSFSLAHFSPGFPLHTTCSSAYCCNTVINIPRLIVPDRLTSSILRGIAVERAARNKIQIIIIVALPYLSFLRSLV